MSVKYIKKSVENASLILEDSNTRRIVEDILSEVKTNKDVAIRELSSTYDSWSPKSFRLTQTEVQTLVNSVPDETLSAIKWAQDQVRRFAELQRSSLNDIEIETLPGVILGHKNIPVNTVGCYVPGGRYPILASAQMSILTARVAGVKKIIACTPPAPNSNAPSATTVAAMHLAGADEIYVLGGVQALASMAYGCVGMDAVDMIVGPGNQYVAEAKRQLYGKVGIDLLAGPTEVLIIADETAEVEMVATDLLGQAEHGPNSAAILLTNCKKLANTIQIEIEGQLKRLSTSDIAGKAWRDHGEIILVDNINELVEIADELANEHVQVNTSNPDYFLEHMTNYGALFLGNRTCVAYGDKVIGTNHTLPTETAARYTGGLWVGKFLKTCTYQKVTNDDACVELGNYCSKISEVEGFMGHKEQAEYRIRKYGGNE